MILKSLSNKRFSRKLIWASALIAVLPAVVGCSHKSDPAAMTKPETEGDQFLPDSEPRHLHRIFDAQAASGAHADAMLHACHFDGGNPAALNSLGEEKLDLMIADDDALPLAIYIDMPESEKDLADARQKAVHTYLKDRGLQEGQIKVAIGRNESTNRPSAIGIKGELALDQAAQAGGGAAGGVTGGAAGGK